MRSEIGRMVRAWLAAAPDGADVNTLLALVPRDVGDPAPAAVALFAEETIDEWLATGQEPPQTPCLGVLAGEAQPAVRLGQGPVQEVYDGVEVVVALWATRTAGAAGIRDGRAALRAVRQSLNRLNAAPVALRRRNEVELTTITSLSDEAMTSGMGPAALVGAVVATCRVRDLAV